MQHDCKLALVFLYIIDKLNCIISNMEEWDPTTNNVILRCNSCWRTNNNNNKNKNVKIVRTSREKYYCEECLSIYDNLCHC